MSRIGQPYQCNCSYVVTGSNAHCLKSLEPIAPAASEGYGHFYAAVLYNQRVQENGTYVYAKESIQSSSPYATITPPSGWNVTSYTNWGENKCSLSGTMNKGVELDWMQFLWHAWTTPGSYTTLTVRELMSVWNQASGDSWVNLRDAAGVLWGGSSDKRNQFATKGDYAGVNH